MSMNICILQGNVTKDPEVKEVGNGRVAKFSLAINRFWKDKEGNKQEKTSFFDLEAWGPQAKFVESYVKKGSPVLVNAEAKQDTWKTDEGNRSKVLFVVNNLQLLSRKEKAEQTEAVAENKEEVPF